MTRPSPVGARFQAMAGDGWAFVSAGHGGSAPSAGRERRGEWVASADARHIYVVGIGADGCTTPRAQAAHNVLTASFVPETPPCSTHRGSPSPRWTLLLRWDFRRDGAGCLARVDCHASRHGFLRRTVRTWR
ncbi:MAG: hypothetical protein R2854_11035 [Caldilineaceae bacterium]